MLQLNSGRSFARVLVASCLLSFGLTQLAAAASLRCPGAVAGQDPAAPPASATLLPEAAAINALWQDLHPGADGGSGPLGCPIGKAIIVTPDQDPATKWAGVTQRFQRGQILVGRGFWDGASVVAVRGLKVWTVWWKGPTAKGFNTTALPATTQPVAKDWPLSPGATWAHGGNVATSNGGDTVALWTCRNSPCFDQGGSSWERLTPHMDGAARPFDAAARLGVEALARPGVGAAQDRIDALFADWLPCHSLAPTPNGPLGEDTLATASLMMKRTAPCPLTGLTPRSMIIAWLSTLSLPAGQLPGTDTNKAPCQRKGDLDVVLIGLLQLVHRFRTELDGAGPSVVAHLKDVVAPWGGAPRSSAYVEPQGSCLAFGVIETENHLLLQEGAKFLANELRGVDNTANRDWLMRFIRQIVRRDFYEYNALPYTRYSGKALIALSGASDSTMRMGATAGLDWLFTKAVLSGNLDRDERPYRRLPERPYFAAGDWWAGAVTATTAQGALLFGPLQHVHRDIDLELDEGRDEMGNKALTDVSRYPDLGTVEEGALAALMDIADARDYQFPAVLQNWLVRRFTDDYTNRLTYVQAINHRSPIPDDRPLFAQPNSGVELTSGNRNWTMVAGGSAVAPGDPGPPRLARPRP